MFGTLNVHKLAQNKTTVGTTRKKTKTNSEDEHILISTKFVNFCKNSRTKQFKKFYKVKKKHFL
jgi:hypothetical protein